MKGVADLSGLVESRYAELERTSFTQRAAVKRLALATGAVVGAEPRVAKLLQEGIDRVLDSASMKVKDAGAADVRLDLKVALQAPNEGRRVAAVTVSAVPRSGTPAGLTREFKTTLSEPVDDEQWRVLGEGAAYRVISDISPVRITRPALRAAHALAPAPAGNAQIAFVSLDGEPLELRIEAHFESFEPAAREIAR
jgi:hypothetical protein